MSIPQAVYAAGSSYGDGLGSADVSVGDVTSLHGGVGDASTSNGTDKGPLRCNFPGCVGSQTFGSCLALTRCRHDYLRYCVLSSYLH